MRYKDLSCAQAAPATKVQCLLGGLDFKLRPLSYKASLVVLGHRFITRSVHLMQAVFCVPQWCSLDSCPYRVGLQEVWIITAEFISRFYSSVLLGYIPMFLCKKREAAISPNHQKVFQSNVMLQAKIHKNSNVVSLMMKILDSLGS
jgi:hypothetical protein